MGDGGFIQKYNGGLTPSSEKPSFGFSPFSHESLICKIDLLKDSHHVRLSCGNIYLTISPQSIKELAVWSALYPLVFG